MIFVADEKYLSIGDVSLLLKKPLKPELVPVKYSKLFRFISGHIVSHNFRVMNHTWWLATKPQATADKV